MGLNRNINDDSTLAYLFNKTRKGASDALSKAVDAINATIATIQTTLANKVDRTGDTMTGNLTISSTAPYLYIKNTNADYTAVTDTASRSMTVGHRDKNNKYLSYWQTTMNTAGRVSAAFVSRRSVNESEVSNGLALRIAADGTKSVYVDDQGAWRSALGLGSMATINSPVPIANGGTGGAAGDQALRNLGAFNIGGSGIALKAGDNVDTGLEDGYTYYSSQASVSQTLAGTPPTTGSGFKIMQIRSYSSSNYKYQIAFASTEIFIRRRSLSTDAWGAWWIPVKHTDTITIAQGGTGATATTKETTVSNVITAASGITISRADYAVWGKLAQLFIQFKRSSAISVPADGNFTDITVGTLVSGKRPTIYTTCVGAGSPQAWGYISSNGSVVLTALEGTGATRTVAANTTLELYATYILA